MMFPQRAQNMALSLMIFIRVGEDRHETQPIKRILDADGEFGEERVGQIADDHADKVGGRRAKTGGAAIVDITETLHRLFDALPRFALHEGGVAQDQRHGRLRHASGARDIDHRGRPARDGFPLHQRSSPPETMAQRKSLRIWIVPIQERLWCQRRIVLFESITISVGTVYLHNSLERSTLRQACAVAWPTIGQRGLKCSEGRDGSAGHHRPDARAMLNGLWLADAPAYPSRQCVGRAVRRKHARLMDLRRSAFAARELHLGDRDEHFGAGLEVGGFQQRLLFPRAIGAQHRQAVDQRLVGGVLDVVPVDFEFVGLREFAQSGEQACAVDGALALAFVEIAAKIRKNRRAPDDRASARALRR